MPDVPAEANTALLAESVNPALIANVSKAVTSLFPIVSQNGLLRIEASNIVVDGSKFDPNSLNVWQNARQLGKTVSVPISADLTLIRDGKVTQRLNRFRLGQLPLMGALGSMQVNGSDYFSPKQFRLKPGVYSRQQANGEYVSFIPMKGAVMKLHLGQTDGVFKVELYGSNVSFYGLIRALGVTDDQLVTAWGNDAHARELLEKNQVKNNDKDLAKFFKNIFSANENKELIRAGIEQRDESLDHVDKAGQVVAISEWMKTKALDPYVTKKTLGKAYDSMSPQVLVEASRRLLEVSRGTAEPDDRDSIEFKTIHGVEDSLPERITKFGKRLTRKLLSKLSKPDTTLAKGFGVNWLNPATVGYFGGTRDTDGGLSHTSASANPLALLSETSKVTLMGEGGIGSDRAISTEARLFRPSSSNFIDLTHSPEGSNIGITTHLAWNTRKVGNTIESLYLKVNGGIAKDPVWLTAEKAADSIIGYSDYWDIGKTGKPMQPRVRAIINGAIDLVPATQVQYVIPSGRSLFDMTSNAALFADATSANRMMMAGKHLTQALPLVHREHPLATLVDGRGNSVMESLAKTFTIRSKVDGIVTKVTPTEIDVGDTKHEIFSNYPFQVHVALDHIAVVKVGDKVTKGQLIADSNYSKDGKLALGVNLRVMSAPWKNASSYEDAIVVSDSAAKKLASYHTTREELELVPGTIVDKKLAHAQFPTLFTDVSFDALDATGVVKDGTKVVSGQVLIAAVRKATIDVHDATVKNLESIHKLLARPYKNACITWDSTFPATVSRIVRTAESIIVHLKTEEELQVGDKLSNSAAAKGTISAIIPDDQMPHTKDGKHVEIIMSPHGVVGRVNPSQTIESAVGLLVKGTGKPFNFANFAPDNNYAADVSKKLKDAGLEHGQIVHDPVTGKDLEKPVGVGYGYFVKLDHSVRKKLSSRERNGYTADETPTKGKGVGAQSYDQLTTFALLGHNAHALLGESAGIRGTKNDDFWNAFQAGETPPPPKVPFVFEKFKAFLNAAGVDTQQRGNTLHYLPITEKAVRERSNGEIKDATMIKAKGLVPEVGGLFDPTITGAKGGQHWAHIELGEKIPHPLYEKTIRDITGIKTADYYGLLAHTKHYNPRTNEFEDTATDHNVTGEAGFKKLLGFDIDDKISEYRTKLRTAVGSDANKYNRAVRYLRGLKETKLTPAEAYMTSAISVIPPIYRPIIEMKGGAIKVADSNLLYRDVILTNKALAAAKESKLPEDIQAKARVDRYRSVAALVGVNDALTHRADREDAQGFIDVIRGKRNKEGLFQSLVVRHRNDYSGRSVIEPDDAYGVDEIGIPEDMAWKIYKPVVVRRLSQAGSNPADAMEQVENRTLSARAVLDDEMKSRPVLYNRAPSLHRWSIAAAYPRISSGKEIKVSPLILGPTGGDADGDTYSVTVPITDAAKDESLKLLGSNNLLYDKDRTLAYNVSKDIVSGIFALTKPGSSSGKNYETAEDAIAAYHNNKDGLQMGSLVKIKGRPAQEAVGWLIFEKIVPQRFLAGVSAPITGKKLDQLLTVIATRSPSDYNVISRQISQAGFQFAAAAGGISSTVDELNIDRGKINRLLDQMESRIDKAGKDKASRSIEAAKAYKEINPQLDAIVKEHLEKTDLGFHSFNESGSNNKKIDQLKQMLASPVLMSDVYDKIVPAVIKTSYGQGMAPSDYVLTTPGSRKGLVARSLATALPGALSKEINANVADIRIYEKDCGTSNGIDETLKTPDVDLLDRHLLRDIVGTQFKRNDVVTVAMLSILRDKHVNDIWVRSPMTCQAPSPPCQMCAGRAPNGKLWGIGSNIGTNYGQAISERSTQLTLRAFHAGGTIGSGDALNAGFAHLKELLSVPDVIRNQGTLATTSGRVDNIRTAPQGGHFAYVDGVEHHIQQGRDLVVKNGDTVKAGDALSNGSFKPQEIAQYRGSLAAQQYVVNEARKSYQDAGAVVRKPVLEVLAAGLMRTVEITDDGGEPSISVGDTMHENQYLKLKAKNSKIQATPMLLGLNAAPLKSQDLMARLNFQRLDDAIRDVPSSAGSSDLTGGRSPIPGLAYGAAFREDADSQFNTKVQNL